MKSVRVDGDAIRKAREFAGFTQPELAKKLGIDQSSVSHWESSRKAPGPVNFKKLCRALRVSRESLLVVPDDQAA